MIKKIGDSESPRCLQENGLFFLTDLSDTQSGLTVK